MTVMLDLEAKAFQEAFCEYYEADVLDYFTAIACVDEIRYEGGLELAAEMMEASVNEPLARAMENGDAEKARVALNLDEDAFVASSDIEIGEEDLRALFDIAQNRLRVSVPAYAADGKTIVGEYSFVRL